MSEESPPPMVPPPVPGRPQLPPWRQPGYRLNEPAEAEEAEGAEGFSERGPADTPGTRSAKEAIGDPADASGFGGYSFTGSAIPYSSLRVGEPSRALENGQAASERTMAVPAAMGANQVKIGLWGSTASGKTTYLAALRHAIGGVDTSNGSWNIYPLNDNSAQLLIKFTHDLVHERKFPEGTPIGASIPLQWLFVGDLAGSRFAPRHRRFARRMAGLESRFVLDLIDVSGRAFAYQPEKESVSPNVVSDAIDHLAEAQGLIYLFDPISEKSNRDSSTYVNRTITELSQRFVNTGRVGRYLPHYISVCVTKFDHPEVFQQARRRGWVNWGPDGMPRVSDEHAEKFFAALCAGQFWGQRDERGDGSAQFIREQLKTSFHPGRIRYFVTSSIGFWRPPGWNAAASSFNPEDFANYHVKNGVASIKGPIQPINVLEPLISLQQQLAGRA